MGLCGTRAMRLAAELAGFALGQGEQILAFEE